MAEQSIRSSNRKYQRERRLKEAVAAIGFLIPNFAGFLVITFLPIFSTFLLSFTQWDGSSQASKSQLKVKLSVTQPAQENIAFPEKATVVYTRPVIEYWQKDITLPYVIKKDIVITEHDSTVGISDILTLKEWNYAPEKQVLEVPSREEILALSEKYKLEITQEDLDFIQPRRVFFDQNELIRINPRFAEPVPGLARNMVIDMSSSGSELGVVSSEHEKEIVIPKGTVVLADVFINTVVSVETQKIVYSMSSAESKRPVILKGNTESKNIEIISSANGRLHTNDPTKISSFLSFEGFPEGMNVEVKFITKQGNDGIKWVGLKNYQKILFTDTRFKDYLLNTLFFLVIVPIGMAVSLILALAMNQPLKGIVAFRVLYFLPVISNIVAVALVWRWILNSDYGLLNQFLRFIGIENPPQWFSSEWWARIAIVIVEVWKGAGYNMMLYLAGLQGIPHDFYEAAEIDGASPWQQFWNITWPLLGPTNFFVLIMGVIGGFQAFGTQYVLTGGGPKGATTTIVYYIYNNAFQWSKMGYATAISVILFIFVMIITAIQWKVNEGKVEY